MILYLIKALCFQEKIDVSFEMESIALPLNRTLRSQTKMCVKMKITNDGETVSQWKEQCALVITGKNKKMFKNVVYLSGSQPF